MKTTALHREYKRYALAERGLKPRTLRDILAAVRLLCAFAGTEEIEALTTSVVRGFLQHGHLERGWAARTFRLYWQYLKAFFDWCVESEYLDGNPVSPIRKPRLPQTLPRCLSRSEARQILYASTHAPWRSELQRARAEAIVATFLMTGLRRAELLSLGWGDVDFAAGVLTVRCGKGSKDRGVPLHPRLVPILQRYLSERQRSGFASEWLFTSLRSGQKLTEKNLYAIVKEVSRTAGVKFTPHMLRHTFGRELIEADFNIYKLKEVMGHASVSTTQAYVALSSHSIKASFDQTKIY